MMLFVDNGRQTDPKLNLALEEYLLRQATAVSPLFLLYANHPAVVLGRNQNVYEEVDPDYLATHNIELVRRLSGGGTVYHDAGNLNFSFIMPSKEGLHDYERFTTPIIAALARFGITARLERGGALFVGDKKISGHAQYATAKRLLSHGTLLFTADMTHLRRSLRSPFVVTQSSAVASVRSSVVNLRELLPPTVTLADLQEAIRIAVGADGVVLTLSAAEWAAVAELAQKYADWAWLYGRSPRCRLQNRVEFPAGEVEAHIEVQNGRIHALDLYPNFFDHADIAELAAHFIGLRYEREALLNRAASIPLTPYVGQVTTAAFVKLLYS